MILTFGKGLMAYIGRGLMADDQNFDDRYFYALHINHKYKCIIYHIQILLYVDPLPGTQAVLQLQPYSSNRYFISKVIISLIRLFY